jgi:predicted amidohydrolase YtcJ
LPGFTDAHVHLLMNDTVLYRLQLVTEAHRRKQRLARSRTLGQLPAHV